MGTNTRILKHQFEYVAPRNLEEALELLAKTGPGAMLLAGGTDVIANLKLERIAPEVLIDISRLAELGSIVEGGGLTIGAATKLHAVEQHCAGRADYGCLHDSIRSIGKVQVLNMGTLAGNLCTASPAADSAPSLLVLDAEVELQRLQGARTTALADFLTGPGQTSLKPGEIMTSIKIPAPISDSGSGSGSAFIKIARVESDISKITCAVSVRRKEDKALACKIAVGAAAPTAIRIPEAEALLSDAVVTADLLEQCGQAVSAGIKPIDDQRSTAEYRTKITAQLFKDTFEIAWDRAGGGK